MAEAKTKEFKKTKGHQRYYLKDGTLVPGVTTVLNILNKPALVGWANRLGLQGIDSTKYVDAKAEIGTVAHYLIECYLKGEKPDQDLLDEYPKKAIDQAENGYLKFLYWLQSMEAQHGKFHLVGSEMQLVSEDYGFGGTIDIYGYFAGNSDVVEVLPGQWLYVLIDIKTSGSGIWPEMKHQVSAYRKELLENGHRVDKVIICRVGRDEDEGYEAQEVTKLDTHFELFKRCLDIYRLQKLLNGKE